MMKPSRGSSTTVVVAVAATAAVVTIAVVFVISRRRFEKKKGKTKLPAGGKLESLVWQHPLSKLPTDRPVPVVDAGNVLGEGPVWCSRKQELWWVDINGKKIMTLRGDNDNDISAGSNDSKLVVEGWDVPKRPGSLAVREGAEREADCPLLVAFEDAFSFYNPSTGKRAPAAAPGAPDEYRQLPNTRLNDGRCDRQGRFISGAVNMEDENQSIDVWKPRGGVYRVECGTGGGVRRILPEESFRCYNTTCFSLDGSVMYLSDSPMFKIWCFDYDVVSGLASNKRVFVDMTNEHVFPDGAAVDADGCLWVALFGTGVVRRYSPEGRLMHTINVPGAKKITCVAFGGRDLDILFITSASIGLSDKERLEQPHAGALFAIRMTDVKGVPEAYFLG